MSVLLCWQRTKPWKTGTYFCIWLDNQTRADSGLVQLQVADHLMADPLVYFSKSLDLFGGMFPYLFNGIAMRNI